MFLNVHSYHSLRYGTLSLQDIVSRASSLGITTLALTDINTVTGIYEFYKLCKIHQIKPIVGVDIREGDTPLYITLAKNPQGLEEINRLLTRRNCEGEALPTVHPPLKQVFIIYPLNNAPETLLENEYLGLRPEEIPLLFQKQWKTKISKMVVLSPVTIFSPQQYNLHRILRAIDRNTLLSNLEPQQLCKRSEVLIPNVELLQHYQNYPQIIENTEDVISQCHFTFDFSTPKNRKTFTESQEKDAELLRSLAFKGLEWRYPSDPPEARERLERELSVIDQLEFSAYFLITWDIVRYSLSQNLMHVGRGSGANSIVSYCLGITDICPLELDLYFERFLNLSRKNPPDFDIDWSWQDRDKILSYIFNKYGKDHVAFCGTNVEFKYRSIFREVGKVFGLPKEDLDHLAKNAPENHEKQRLFSLIEKYGKMLEKFPNQRSMHSCGILISQEPLTRYSALEMPPKGFAIVQFDMHVAEALGFEKFDILSQRGLGTISDAVTLIEKNQGVRVDIRDTSLSKDHPQANRYLSEGRTLGCFYIESPAMRGLLRRLKCNNYHTLVAASSIIRPGVAQSGMMREYIFRHNNPGKFEYFHPVFKEHLGDTYGIMVYQEDVIKIALHYGGVSAQDGDVLRRAMSGKTRSKKKLLEVKDHFFACAQKRGHPEALSREVYRQIESFAGYSFCKAHSASYAVESYQSLYLKVHYPIEFMVAAINNGGGFYRTEVYVHECRKSGGQIHVPCVNKSLVETTLYGKEVYLGLGLIENLEHRLVAFMVEERIQKGPYRDLEDFIKRTPIGIESLQALIFVGAFNFTGKPKNELLIQARMLLIAEPAARKQEDLFEITTTPYRLPQLRRNPLEDAFDEIELLGFPVSSSPFDLLKTSFRGDVMAKDLLNHHKKQVRMLAYLVARKHVPTKQGAMYFGTWIDHKGEFFDSAHFPSVLKAYPFQGGGCYLLLGTVEVDYHFATLTVHKMAKLPFIADPRYHEDKEKAYEVYQKINEDVSMTWRKPYPQEHEIGLPRQKMNT